MKTRAKKEYCKRGHQRIPENLFISGACKLCACLYRTERHKPKIVEKKTHCLRGHARVPENLDTKGSCKLCASERSLSWERAHRDRTRVSVVKSKSKHPETVEKWRALNADKLRMYGREATRKRRKLHPEQVKAASLKWARNNPDKVKAAQRIRKLRQWKEHPEKVRESNRKRSMFKKGVHGHHTLEQFKALGSICLRCGRSDVPMTRDHVLPLIHKGNDNISNIQPLCLSCNCWKHDKFIDYRKGSEQAFVAAVG